MVPYGGDESVPYKVDLILDHMPGDATLFETLRVESYRLDLIDLKAHGPRARFSLLGPSRLVRPLI